MDLFGDLPEPSSKELNNSLYDDLPTQTTQTKLAVAMVPDTSKRKAEGDQDGQNVAKKVKSASYKLTTYLAERQGEREDMQDAHLIVNNFHTEFTNLHPSISRMSVFGVFDGHAGVRASRFASQHLHNNVRHKFPKGDISQVERDIRKSFIEAFKKTDDDFLKEATKNKPAWKDGTTAILLLVINDTLYIANIGDSQAVLCRHKPETGLCVPVPLSVAHNPSVYEERIRIQKHGGHVKDGRVLGVLEVSRSIGDGQYKKLGVTCTPDVKKCQLSDNDRYIIVACDGLWKCFEPEDSIKFVNSILENDSLKATDSKSCEDVRFEAACNKLANEAVLRLSGDNVTVMLIRLSK